MVDWNKLELDKTQTFAEASAVKDWDDIPEERGASKSNLPMARFAFLLPQNVDSLWSVADTNKHGKRASLNFNQEPLLVVQAPTHLQELVGSGWYGLISGIPRNRASRGEPELLVADLFYLLKYGFGFTGKKPASNDELRAAIKGYAGKTFAADNEWSSYCNSGKPRYVFDPESQRSIEDPEGKVGCGKNYYARDIPRDGGVPVDRWVCECGASLRAFQNLSRYGVHGA